MRQTDIFTLRLGDKNANLMGFTDDYSRYAAIENATDRLVDFVSNHALWILSRTRRVLPPAYADRREPALRSGYRVRVIPRGIPLPSTTTIHFVPLSGWFLQFLRTLLRRSEAVVQKPLAPLQLLALVLLVEQCLPDVQPDALFLPTPQLPR